MSSQSIDEVTRLRRYYADYHSSSEWATDSAGNRAMHDERWRALQRLITRLPCPLPRASILDVGCGTGSLLGTFASWGADARHLAGVDLMADRIAMARQQQPGIRFEVANAERLPFDDASFDIVSTFTVFSSLLDRQMSRNVAAEVARVLKPGGVILWYDMRVNNPRNPNVRGLSRADVGALFPGYAITFETITLAPPLARRLGAATRVLYPLLAAVPFLRTHYLGTVSKPPA